MQIKPEGVLLDFIELKMEVQNEVKQAVSCVHGKILALIQG